MEQNPEVQNEDLGDGGKLKNWLQDNIRIIISILIVLLIAGGIYSYSKRTDEMAGEEEVAMQEEGGQEQAEEAEEEGSAVSIIREEEGEAEEEAQQPKEEAVSDMQQKQEETTVESEPEMPQPKEDIQVDTGEEGAVSSEETQEAFVETAQRGDSVTVLARRALKNYLEKNSDPSLTAEHKIYIEDYLRKHVGHQGTLHVGDKISFSKNLIKEGIEKSKTLNERQLENLKKYSARVSNL